MSDLDNEIRRAFEELVNAAPPPPAAPSPVATHTANPARRSSGVLALAAALLLVTVAGVIAYTQRGGSDDTIVISDEPRPTEVSATQPPVATEPPPVRTAPIIIREETGGSPLPSISVELADDLDPSTGAYAVVDAMSMPGTTEPVPAAGEQYDGIYFAYLHEGAGPDDPTQLRFDVVQAFSGPDCAARFGDQAVTVCTPFGTDFGGSVGRLDLDVTDVPISVRDLASELTYRISGAELIALVNGALPSPPAPDGYLFSGGFGFLLTFDNGTLTRIDQPGTRD